MTAPYEHTEEPERYERPKCCGERNGEREGYGELARWKIFAYPAALSVVLGALGGVVWALLAPVEQFWVVSPGRGAALTGESVHRFDALALLVCISLVLGIALPVGFWAWSRARGPILYLGLLTGAAFGSAVALGAGILLAGRLHPRPDDPAAGSVVSVAPGFESPLVLVVQPLVASLVVLLLVAMNPHDNLRFSPEVEPELDVEPSPGFESQALGADRA